MNHPTNQNARGSALTTLIGGIVILLATLYLLVPFCPRDNAATRRQSSE